MAGKRRGTVTELAPGVFKIRVSLARKVTGQRGDRVVKHVRGTRKEAEAELTRLLAQDDQGRLAKAKKDRTGAYLERWLTEAARPRIAVATADMYRYFLDKYVLPTLGPTQLAKLTPLDVQGLYNALGAKGLSPAYVRRIHGMLHSALRQAVRWELIPRNPSDLVTLPKGKKPEMHAMSMTEVARFIEAATTDRHYVLWAFLVETGARPGEALALRWKEVDLAAGTATIRRSLTWTKVKDTDGRLQAAYIFGDTKTGKVRTIPLTPALLADLKRHKAKQAAERLQAGPAWVDEDLVFPTDLGTPHRDENLRGRHFLQVLLKAGLAKPIERERPAGSRGPKPSPRIETVFRVYDLRHTCATLLLAAGENVKVVSERLGHASVQLTLDHYAHVLPGMQARATETLGALLYRRTGSGS